MTASTIGVGQPFDTERLVGLKSDFSRDGYLHVPGILQAAEVAVLKEAIDRVFADPEAKARGNVQGDFIALRLFETDQIFEEMLTREPMIGLMECLLGQDCHLIAQNALRNAPGQAIDSFHVDDTVVLPVAERMERHDPRLTLPAFIINVSFPLTDIPTVDYGPTQYVPGSHYSGRQPNDPKNPQFEGRGPVSLLAKAGDMILFNNQGWHRGAPNNSDRTRYYFGMSAPRYPLWKV